MIKAAVVGSAPVSHRVTGAAFMFEINSSKSVSSGSTAIAMLEMVWCIVATEHHNDAPGVPAEDAGQRASPGSIGMYPAAVSVQQANGEHVKT